MDDKLKLNFMSATSNSWLYMFLQLLIAMSHDVVSLLLITFSITEQLKPVFLKEFSIISKYHQSLDRDN